MISNTQSFCFNSTAQLKYQLARSQYYMCFVGPLQASGGRRHRDLAHEMNLGKPTDKQKFVGEDWAPYWTQTRIEIQVN